MPGTFNKQTSNINNCITMKPKKYNRYLVPAIACASMAVSSLGHAQGVPILGDTVYGDLTVTDNSTVGGNLTVTTPNPAPVSTGTAPTASIPIGNDKNTGFTDPGTPGLLNTYSTNGSGVQTQLVQTSGGVVINPNGNVTLTKERTQTETVTYTIESREIKVSDPAGFTDALGEYGIPGTFYPNGTTLPGTTEDVATVRDAAGNLLSVISDLPGVGPVTAVDGAGNPILDEAQVAAALVAGAPAGFFDPGTSVATPNTGNLSVEGQTTTNGIDNSGAKITNLADGTAPTDAATVGQVDAEEARAIAAEGDLDGKITTEKTKRQAADVTLDSKFSSYQAAQSTLISKKSNGQIHIGENSLITQEVDGVQKLFAQDASGKAINIDVSNGTDLLVDGVSVATDDDISAIRNDYQTADRNLRSDIDSNTRGIAMVAAMTNTTIQPGMTQGVDFNISQFESETGFAFGYAHRINENVQVHGSAASTTDFDVSVGRLGVSFQW
jgi:hypothetical protein